MRPTNVPGTDIAAADTPGTGPISILSPCVSVCSLDRQAGWCTGCLRTLDEIAAWSSTDDAGKRRIIEACTRRKITLDH